MENQQILALESNRKIQRLESELEEERQLNYSANKRKNTEIQETKHNTDSINIYPDNQEEKIVSHFNDVIKSKNENKQQNSESQETGDINNVSKDVETKENRSKKSFWVRLFGN
ncbi:putative replication-associated protein [Staphylococcus intermedius NCTC 11048]|uniref:Putative replication-associated protein n=1 Tax=Staphylococcus intermedius NCTC 11048 TaxID=1141106 RepID=A0A380G0N2_STAIN|nr:putative replication-associated protein [Staphylococcus intermedius NCTC 11048]